MKSVLNPTKPDLLNLLETISCETDESIKFDKAKQLHSLVNNIDLKDMEMAIISNMCTQLIKNVGKGTKPYQRTLLSVITTIAQRGAEFTEIWKENAFAQIFNEKGITPILEELLNAEISNVEKKGKEKVLMSELSKQLVIAISSIYKQQYLDRRILSFCVNTIGSQIKQLIANIAEKQKIMKQNTKVLLIEQDIEMKKGIKEGIQLLRSLNIILQLEDNMKYAIKTLNINDHIIPIFHINCQSNLKCSQRILLPESENSQQLQAEAIKILSQLTDLRQIKEVLLDNHKAIQHTTSIIISFASNIPKQMKYCSQLQKSQSPPQQTIKLQKSQSPPQQAIKLQKSQSPPQQTNKQTIASSSKSKPHSSLVTNSISKSQKPKSIAKSQSPPPQTAIQTSKSTSPQSVPSIDNAQCSLVQSSLLLLHRLICNDKDASQQASLVSGLSDALCLLCKYERNMNIGSIRYKYALSIRESSNLLIGIVRQFQDQNDQMLLIRDHGFVREQISIIGSCGGSCEEKYGIIWSGMRNMRQLFKDMRRKSGERRRDDILELKYVVDEQIEQFGGLSEIDAQQFRFDFEDGGFDQDRFSALGLLSQIINAQIGSQSNLGDDEQDDQDILNHFLEIYNEYTDENEDIICVD